MPKVHLCAVAGGEAYSRYADSLMQSAEKFFRPSEQTEYHILDGVEGWPNGTLFRYHCLLDQLDASPRDYIFLCDADMRFADHIGPEVIPPGGIVSTFHPGYVGSVPDILPFEDRKGSAAYVPPQRRKHYYAGGFVGGRADAMWILAKWIERGIRKDIGRGIIARWHDESHLNCYLAECPPAIALSPAYCHPDNDSYYLTIWPSQYARKLVALDKNQEERGDR